MKQVKSKLQAASRQQLGVFASAFNRFWEPTWRHVGQIFRAKTTQEAFKTPPRRLQDASKTVQDASTFALDGARRLKTSMLVLPGLNFYGLIHFGMVWGSNMPDLSRSLDLSSSFAMVFRFRNFFSEQPRQRAHRSAALWIFII